MARVSHKKIKQLIQQRRKTVTDSQFFSSRLLAGHFEDLAAAQTRRYGYTRRVKVRTVWEPDNQNAACTNNDLIWLNAGHSLVTAKSTRPDRYDIVCGFFAHELGHVLYTDFLTAQSHAISFKSLRWYPGPPALETPTEDLNEADLWAYAKSDTSHVTALIKFSQILTNIIEDGYIENCMINRYPGVLGNSLGIMRASQFEDIPTLTRLIENESDGSHIWVSIAQLILSYVKFGELKYGDEPFTDERVQTVFSILSELDDALTAESAKDRWDIINLIMVQCWPYIKSFLEQCEQKSAVPGTYDSSADSELDSQISGISGQSREAAGTTAPVAVKKIKKACTPAKSKKTKAQQTVSSGTSENPGSDEQETTGAGTFNQKASGSDATDKEAETELSGQESAEAGASDEKSANTDALDEESADTDAAEDEAAGTDPAEQGPIPDEPAEPDAGTTENEPDSDQSESVSEPNEPYQDVSPNEGGRIPLCQTDSVNEHLGGDTAFDNDYNGSG